MGTRLIIEENTIYEIDEDCMCEKERKEQQLKENEEKKKAETIPNRRYYQR